MEKTLSHLIIHCTATPAGRAVTAQNIRDWHTLPLSKGGRGWTRVGYSDLIGIDGQIINLVEYNENEIVENNEITNGVAGINGISRHIVYVGGLDSENFTPKDTRTPAQKLALEFLVRRTLIFHPDIVISGHNQWANKACPCFNVPEWLKSLKINERNIK